MERGMSTVAIAVFNVIAGAMALGVGAAVVWGNAASATTAVVGVVVGVLAVMLLSFRQVVGLLCIVAVMTKFYVPWGEAQIRPDLIVLPLAVLSGVLRGEIHKVGQWVSKPPLVALALWVALQGVVSIAYAPDRAASLFVVTLYVADLCITLLALAAFGDDRPALERALLFSAVFLACSGLVAWAQAFVAGVDNWGAIVGLDTGARASGVAIEPNILAAWAAIWIVIVLTAGHVSKRAALALVPLVLVIPLTTTRAAVLGVAVGLLIYFLGSPSIVRRVLPAGVLLILAAATMHVFASDYSAAIIDKLSDVQFQDYNSIYRYMSWRLAMEDVSGSWLFGLGTNTFQQRHVSPTSDFFDPTGYYLAALPLQVLHDTGILGVVLVGFAALTLLRSGHRLRRLAVMMTFLVTAIATSPFYLSSWWLLIAVALAQQPRSRDELPGCSRESGDLNVLEVGRRARLYARCR